MSVKSPDSKTNEIVKMKSPDRKINRIVSMKLPDSKTNGIVSVKTPDNYRTIEIPKRIQKISAPLQRMQKEYLENSISCAPSRSVQLTGKETIEQGRSGGKNSTDQKRFGAVRKRTCSCIEIARDISKRLSVLITN